MCGFGSRRKQKTIRKCLDSMGGSKKLVKKLQGLTRREQTNLDYCKKISKEGSFRPRTQGSLRLVHPQRINGIRFVVLCVGTLKESAKKRKMAERSTGCKDLKKCPKEV